MDPSSSYLLLYARSNFKSSSWKLHSVIYWMAGSSEAVSESECFAIHSKMAKAERESALTHSCTQDCKRFQTQLHWNEMGEYFTHTCNGTHNCKQSQAKAATKYTVASKSTNTCSITEDCIEMKSEMKSEMATSLHWKAHQLHSASSGTLLWKQYLTICTELHRVAVQRIP